MLMNVHNKLFWTGSDFPDRTKMQIGLVSPRDRSSTGPAAPGTNKQTTSRQRRQRRSCCAKREVWAKAHISPFARRNRASEDRRHQKTHGTAHQDQRPRGRSNHEKLWTQSRSSTTHHRDKGDSATTTKTHRQKE